jgi:hypothetical protein
VVLRTVAPFVGSFFGVLTSSADAGCGIALVCGRSGCEGHFFEAREESGGLTVDQNYEIEAPHYVMGRRF